MLSSLIKPPTSVPLRADNRSHASRRNGCFQRGTPWFPPSEDRPPHPDLCHLLISLLSNGEKGGTCLLKPVLLGLMPSSFSDVILSLLHCLSLHRCL